MGTRRSFLANLALPGLLWTALPARASAAHPFAPAPGADDAAVFAAAREQFLIPAGIAYCNTGTLGACPREVIDAL
jgi:hypothetical protein